MFTVQTKENGEWLTLPGTFVTQGDAMNKTDILFRFHGKEARALKDDKPFYSREQGKSNARQP